MFAFLDARFLACFGPLRGSRRPPAFACGKFWSKTHQTRPTRKAVTPDDGIGMNVRFLGRPFFALFWPVPWVPAPTSFGGPQILTANAPKPANPKSCQP